MSRSTRSNNSPATNRKYRETSIINIDSDGENQDTNQDAPYELDSEYMVPLGHPLGPVADFVDKGKQHAQNDEGAEDGDYEDDDEYSEDEDDEMFDGDYIFEDSEDENVDENGASQEEVNEWARIQLEKIDKDIDAAQKKINDLDEKKKKAEGRAIDNRTKFRLEHAAKKLGAHQLQKIHKQQTGAEHSAAKTSTELQKAQERLASLEALRDDIEFDTVAKYNEALQKQRPKKQHARKDNRQYPPEHNLESADDSLAEPIREQERKAREKQRKAREAREGKKTTKKAKKTNEDDETDDEKKSRACQRCRLAKQKCTYIPGNSSCDRCAIGGERCRYQDYFTGQQIRPNYLQDKLAELAAVKAELANFRQKSAASAGAENPLSGITGYGPSTQKWARQNWALLVRGLPPRPLLPTSTPDDHSASVSVKRKSPTDPIDGEPSQLAKRQRQMESQSNPPPKQYSFQNKTVESFAGPSKRGRKPGQISSTRTARKTTRQQQQQAVPSTPPEEQNNEPPSYEFTFECPVPADDSTNPTHPPTANQPLINAASVSNTKLWWAQMISDRGGQLPVNVLFTPGWPRWADYMNEKQELWFNALYSAGIQIPLVEGKSIDDDGGVEPLWPSWTRVLEVLDDDKIDHLVQCVQGEYEIREFHSQDGVGQGTVDWQHAEIPPAE